MQSALPEALAVPSVLRPVIRAGAQPPDLVPDVEPPLRFGIVNSDKGLGRHQFGTSALHNPTSGTSGGGSNRPETLALQGFPVVAASSSLVGGRFQRAAH